MSTTFITWYPYCRRSDALAEALGGSSHLLHYLRFKQPIYAPFKYVAQTLATLRALRRERPRWILVAVPPVFAALPVLLYARRYGCRVAIDAHTGIFDDRRWTWLMPLTRFVFRRADSVIVTNAHLQEVVESWGARSVIIGDVPVRFTEGVGPPPCDAPRVVVINTFSDDEPIAEVVEAARQCADTRFFVTGDLRSASKRLLASVPPNLSFTDFLPEEEYAGLLRSAEVVVVLTTHDHTMQRGGYEAVALAKPLVTSDWGLLRETFSRGTVHVDNSASAIARGVSEALSNRESLELEMQGLRIERATIFETRLTQLRDALQVSTLN